MSFISACVGIAKRKGHHILHRYWKCYSELRINRVHACQIKNWQKATIFNCYKLITIRIYRLMGWAWRERRSLLIEDWLRYTFPFIAGLVFTYTSVTSPRLTYTFSWVLFILRTKSHKGLPLRCYLEAGLPNTTKCCQCGGEETDMDNSTPFCSLPAPEKGGSFVHLLLRRSTALLYLSRCKCQGPLDFKMKLWLPLSKPFLEPA